MHELREGHKNSVYSSPAKNDHVAANQIAKGTSMNWILASNKQRTKIPSGAYYLSLGLVSETL